MEQFRVTPIIPLHIGGYDVSFTNQALVMCVIVFLTGLFVTFSVRQGRLVPTRTQSLAEISYEFVGNMIHSAAGEAGYRFFPFVFAIFMFVLCANFFGLIPGVFTVTSQIAVNFALAIVIVLTVIVTGFIMGPVITAPLLLFTSTPLELLNAISSVVYMVVVPFAAVGLALLYFDLKLDGDADKQSDDAAH